MDRPQGNQSFQLGQNIGGDDDRSFYPLPAVKDPVTNRIDLIEARQNTIYRIGQNIKNLFYCFTVIRCLCFCTIYLSIQSSTDNRRLIKANPFYLAYR